jgi:hypothetical protein
MANVMPAWLGAMSAWLLRWPAELQAQRPIEMETYLQQETKTDPRQLSFIWIYYHVNSMQYPFAQFLFEQVSMIN